MLLCFLAQIERWILKLEGINVTHIQRAWKRLSSFFDTEKNFWVKANVAAWHWSLDALYTTQNFISTLMNARDWLISFWALHFNAHTVDRLWRMSNFFRVVLYALHNLCKSSLSRSELQCSCFWSLLKAFFNVNISKLKCSKTLLLCLCDQGRHLYVVHWDQTSLEIGSLLLSLRWVDLFFVQL